ncbi:MULTISPECIES: energy-coupling factor ABC transporter ATP-binding protein [unclassified Candidatus Frackibacter]|uniref:energy-coupling factor ABC transporter ATP-binding protein n=1 Tax=unclassified Candidatus Frackibacter TaxID=2648818 RepID=UPI00088B7471|nr:MULTISPECIES: ATP-binding cassette domain-containing protein [unclassified Candidatus Frackibacter]SDC34387.1 cobalt/nickel transport system ATP-binding protein [Candidatus Frackibacter sp. WG11]SEM56875.1 cobalt/nickel transport system ATP-binding protein [Candidatus Frackibacter sp. WG12]SFL70393.1 cobalt/nickel transport system ATP-binding protein [Candidatus Frackibacter sp. WG13]
MSSSILEAEDIIFSYPDGTKALDGLSISIEEGKKVAILGANGAGKSTLFLHFNGILQPDQGSIKFKGETVKYNKRALKELRKNVGIVFQDPDMQLFSSSVFQEISFGPLNLGLSEEEVRARVNEAMKVTGITELKDRPTHLLSYGQKKRISIADILAMKPQAIIFDEPTVWLDPRHSNEIIDFFDEINNQGITVILSTHDVNLAYSWADYVYIFAEGKIIGEGVPSDIFQDKELLMNADLTQPWIVEVYNELVQKNILASDFPIPDSKRELFSLL